MFFFPAHTLNRRRLAALRRVEFYKLVTRTKLGPPESREYRAWTQFSLSTFGFSFGSFCGVLEQQIRKGPKLYTRYHFRYQLCDHESFSLCPDPAMLRSCFSRKGAEIQLRAKKYAPTAQRFMYFTFSTRGAIQNYYLGFVNPSPNLNPPWNFQENIRGGGLCVIPPFLRFRSIASARRQNPLKPEHYQIRS